MDWGESRRPRRRLQGQVAEGRLVFFGGSVARGPSFPKCASVTHKEGGCQVAG